jgi:hypothetical protein
MKAKTRRKARSTPIGKVISSTASSLEKISLPSQCYDITPLSLKGIVLSDDSHHPFDPSNPPKVTSTASKLVLVIQLLRLAAAIFTKI